MPCKCTKCNVRIQNHVTGLKYIDDEPYCKHCYYEELGEVIEQHPIGGPGIYAKRD